MGAVVTNHNGGQNVIDCLQALCHNESYLAEIIVVDNASEDGSPARIEDHFPQVRLIRLENNRGPCVARNHGLAALSTTLALVLDDDVRLAPDALSLMLEALQRSGTLVVCPRILLSPDGETIQADGVAPHFLGTLALRHGFAPLALHPVLPDAPPAVPVKGCPSACLLVNRQAVLDAGGFDELYFFYFEDLEFSIRLRSLGHDIGCAERAVVYHDRGPGTPGLSYRGEGGYPKERFYLSTRNRLMTIFVYYRWRTLFILTPALAAYELATLLFALRHGFLWTWVRSWVWQFTHRRLIRERRVRIQARRRRSDGELLAGGPIPLAPGVIASRPLKMVLSAFSRGLQGYWLLVQPLLNSVTSRR